MIAKMKTTQLWAQEQLETSHHVSKYGLDEVYTTKEELLADLNLIYRSLCATDNEIEADGFLTDVIRNVSGFGMAMVTLDIRQESTRHEEALDSITRFLGLGSYSQWDEDTRLTWLQQQLASPRPMLRPGAWKSNPDFFSPTAVDTLEIFSMISEQHDGSLGAYVISQCTSASDILAVLVLQRDAGVKKPLRVVPLFETLGDLNGAEYNMKKLFSLPGYIGAINGKHEVRLFVVSPARVHISVRAYTFCASLTLLCLPLQIMIGYSDSAKDAGRLAASWAQYETQEALVSCFSRQ